MTHDIEDFYPLSPTQAGMLFHSLYAPESGVYRQQTSYALKGELDRSAFERAWQDVLQRHPALRTAVVWQDLDEPIQVVSPRPTLPFAYLDWSGLAASEQRDRLRRFLEADREQGFDLSIAPLMRLTLIRLSDLRHHVVCSAHHILLDGWSGALVQREVMALYRSYWRGERLDLAPSRPYKAFVKWLRKQDLSAAEQFWTGALRGFSTPTVLGVERHVPLQGLGLGDRSLRLSAEMTEQLRTFARHNRLTMSTVLQGTWALLLSRYSSTSDVVFGVTVSGRPPSLLGADGIVGVMINTIPMRVMVREASSVVPWLQECQRQFARFREHEHAPLVHIQSWSQLPRGLFDTILVFENFPTQGADGEGDLQVSEQLYVTRTNYSLSMYVLPGTELELRALYERGRFDDAAIARLVGHFQALLEAVVVDPGRPVGELPLLSVEELRRVSVEWNATDAEYPRERSVAGLFEVQVERTPDAVAVVCEGERLTYRELDGRANRLARWLWSRGVEPGVLVGVCVERSLEMLVAVLGVLKSGGGYVPLDPGFPRDRLRFMAADAGLGLVLTSEVSRGSVPEFGGLVVSLDGQWDEIAVEPSTAVASVGGSEDVAYVLYTSGSTGKPKGVEVPHRALTNFLWSMRDRPGFCDGDVLLAVTTLSFDIAGLELYLPLITGGCVVVASRQVAADGRRLQELLVSSGATVMQATPATWRMLLDAGWSGTPGLKVLCGGEGLPQELAHRLLDRCAELWNMYGPTETTIWSSVQQITSGDAEVTIGRPIANTEFYIVDPNLQPVPIGVPGELLIGGDGLAHGYRNRPELTARQFIAHPFSDIAGARVYRTGDLARYRDDGQVVPMGRLDHQVKIRGFRIELGEIETLLNQHPSVHNSVVVARHDDAGDAYLAAYVVAAPEATPTIGDLRRFLQNDLPDYMVPTAFVQLDEFPLTPNGKIDRRSLPEPDHARPTLDSVYVAARTPTERTLVGLWQQLLHVEQVGIHDDFFDLGGHSLLALQLINRMLATFGVDIPLHTLFEAPTIESISELVDRIHSVDEAPASPPTAGPTRPTDSERKLVAIWEDLFDVCPIGTRESFLDLQGDTDRLEEMMMETRRTFGVLAEGLSARTFLREPTIEALAATIDSSMGAGSPSLVVCLQPNGAEKPLFLVHAGGGYVFFYRALAARLEHARPVYAIRAETPADGGGAPFTQAESIEAVAARYVAEVRSVQPEGPYTLGGACIGGVIAFEMAQQLQASGEEIAGPLLLFDSIATNNEYLDAEDLEILRDSGLYRYDRGVAGLWQRVSRKLRDAWEMSVIEGVVHLGRAIVSWASSRLRQVVASTWRTAREVGSHVAGHLRRAIPSVGARIETPEQLQTRFMAESLAAALRLAWSYRPRPLAGRLVLFEAAESGPYERTWRGLATEIVVYDRPGEHLDMLEDPWVTGTASLVEACLRRGADAVAGSRSGDPSRSSPTSDLE